MKVLQVIAAGYAGGGTNHVLQLLRRLSDTYRLSLITQSNSYLLDQGKSLVIPSFGLEFFSGASVLRVPAQIGKIISGYRPDLIHVHGSRAGFFQALATSRVPVIYTVHGFHFLNKPSLRRRLGAMMERFTMRTAAHVIFVSQYDEQVALDLSFLPKTLRHSVIHNGIPVAECPLPAGSADRCIGFIGRLEYQKDPMLFLDVLKELRGFTAVAIGTGSLEGSFNDEVKRRGLAGRVAIFGVLSHANTIRAMRSISSLVITSRWEGLPLLPLEAMSMGVPVIATKVGGLSEVIEHGRSGLLVESRSPQEIARAVLEVHEQPLLREKIVNNARKRVQELFSEEQMMSKTLAIYDEVGRSRPKLSVNGTE